VPQLDSDLPERIISEVDGYHAVVNGKRVINLACANFLNLSGTQEMKAVASETVSKYGVGSCGPRGFYGTIDVHLEVEAAIASFMGCPSCTIFSFDIATVASVIPACANRKDIVIADECVSFPVQQGLTLSRASVHWFKHNDPEDLERVIKKVEEQERKLKKPLCRKIVVVEGVYANTGDIAPLDKIYEIKQKYKYRLLVEESYSFGVIGTTGKGACEHHGLQPHQVEVICASMGTVLGSVGGFCTGAEKAVVEHQRLAGSAYVFSASLPPYLATSALSVLTAMQQDRCHKTLLAKLHSNCAALRAQIAKIPGLSVNSGPCCDSSAIIHVKLASSSLLRDQQHDLLSQMTNIALDKHGVMMSVPTYSNLDRIQPLPSIRIFACAAMTDKDISIVVSALKAAAKEVL
jgi:serine palmitoyltransferase